ncbi:MAG: serine hydrolase domain-containing protein [Hyphomonadaceae bacterium]
MPKLDVTNPADLALLPERLARIPEFFKSYIESERLPCMATLVSRGGDVGHLAMSGAMEMGGQTPISEDTIYRIYSMTKPITAVAAMILFEEGKLRLEHPVSRYLPEYADVKVWAGGTVDAPEVKDPERAMTLLDLFTHTSGITYGFLFQHEVDAIYRKELKGTETGSLREMVRAIAGLPLAFSPGTQFNYGHSIDVLGAIVEEVSGQPLDVFFKERIFGPLGMIDTDFFVPEEKLARLGACYAKDAETGETVLYDGAGAASKMYKVKPTLFNAGGGLVSTLHDYHRFCLMLLGGGELDGERILSPKTIEFMTANHLPDNQTILGMGDKTFAEGRMHGNGFCLLGSVLTDLVAFGQPASEGMFAWGGLASTYFWIDPVEQIIGIQMTQLVPSSTYPIRTQFQQLVYAAIEG